MKRPMKPIRVAFSLSPEEAVWLEQNYLGFWRLGKHYNYSGACRAILNEEFAKKTAKSAFTVVDNDINRKDCEENGGIGNHESPT